MNSRSGTQHGQEVQAAASEQSDLHHAPPDSSHRTGAVPAVSTAGESVTPAALQAMHADVLSLRAFLSDAVEERLVLMQQLVATHKLVQEGSSRGAPPRIPTAEESAQTEHQQEQVQQEHPLDVVVQAERDRAAAEQLSAALKADNDALRAALTDMTQAYDEVSTCAPATCSCTQPSRVPGLQLVADGSEAAVQQPEDDVVLRADAECQTVGHPAEGMLPVDAACQTVRVGPPSPRHTPLLLTPSKTTGAAALLSAPHSKAEPSHATRPTSSSASEASGNDHTPGAARLRPHDASGDSDTSAQLQARLAAANEELVALRAGNSILRQQLKDARRSASKQREEQEALFALQLQAKDEAAAKYQTTMDEQLAALQQQLQVGMAASVQKINQLKAELAEARAELEAAQHNDKTAE